MFKKILLKIHDLLCKYTRNIYKSKAISPVNVSLPIITKEMSVVKSLDVESKQNMKPLDFLFSLPYYNQFSYFQNHLFKNHSTVDFTHKHQPH